MRIEKCSFCGHPAYPGHGNTFVRNDGKVFRFCGAKCSKFFKLRKNPRRTRWTKAFRRTHGKEMAVDSSFAFEQRRNEPVKYNRDLIAKTIDAMKRVRSIKERRERRFWERRMRVKVRVDNGNDLRELGMHLELIRDKAVEEEVKANLARREKNKKAKLKRKRQQKVQKKASAVAVEA
eukprot:NODE_1894_length_732_cov_1355.245974_g1591_i0.p1 GENE.NODE_1894_length_732_cov_1355.245974_g1591_i0~~NODE_1894_length_732_cov_1355.245974_g1591_i0.p1  ORF type:complete len:178 (+),score=25.84 NODE_1894_length_732_cov_1355.245974_g1591_i0:72-605(+)